MTKQPVLSRGAENRNPPAAAMCPMAKRRAHCKIKSGESVNEPSAVAVTAPPSHAALPAAPGERTGQRAGTPQAALGEAQTLRGRRGWEDTKMPKQIICSTVLPSAQPQPAFCEHSQETQ